ncbi:MAG: hypothetical protein K0S55_1620 [Clostridia bacterium]|jgi:hypothetical protein|nr:hypothetical protein [Clostridia bacterium]
MIENKLGKTFDNLAQRIIYSYLATYPKFIFMENIGANESSQKQMYDFLYETVYNIYKNPSIIGVIHEPDAFYENGQLNNTNPALIKSMEKVENKFFKFIEYLYKVGCYGEINNDEFRILNNDWKINKTIIEVFKQVGITCNITKESTILTVQKYPQIFQTWNLYSKNIDINQDKITQMLTFFHGRYFGKKYKVIDFFENLSGNRSELNELENYFILKGFEYYNTKVNAKTRTAYVQWKKDYSNDEQGYMNVFFNWRQRDQLCFDFRVPGFRKMLKSYNKMNENIKKLVFDRTKTCDGCGYCTQMDKTGKRAVLADELTYNDETLNKCPLYPNLTWNYINSNDLIDVKQLFEFSESIL